jgi:hypothetical protein
MHPSKLASLLGRLARGKRKRLTQEEIARRTKVLLAGAKAYRARQRALKAKQLKKKKTKR